MTNDRPLSSEEMIRRAREEMSAPPTPPRIDPGLQLEADEIIEGNEAGSASIRFAPTPRRLPGAAPRDPFDPRSRRGAIQQSQTRIVLGVVVALLIMGIALALALAGSATP